MAAGAPGISAVWFDQPVESQDVRVEPPLENQEVTITRRTRWLRVVPGAILLATCVLIAATTWGAITTDDPSYVQFVLLGTLLGGWLIFSGVRTAGPAKPGRLRLVLRILAAAAAVGFAATLFWLKPFVATPRAIDALQSTTAVTVTDTRSATTYEPATAPTAGLVLYPGARVDPRAYAVLARGVASKGYRVIVVKCPLNIELLCLNSAKAYITSDIPWAVGGHSLGGVIASEYAKKHKGVDGLILWASFPASDLSSRKNLTVASVSGSRDGLSTPQDITDNKHLLPRTTVYSQIRGAVHSYFGDYGKQPGDNTPTVRRGPAQAQIIARTIESLARMVKQSHVGAAGAAAPRKS